MSTKRELLYMVVILILAIVAVLNYRLGYDRGETDGAVKVLSSVFYTIHEYAE